MTSKQPESNIVSDLPALSPFGAAFGEAMEPAKPEHIEAAQRDAAVRSEVIADQEEESAFARAQREMAEREEAFDRRRIERAQAEQDIPLPKALRHVEG